MSLTFPGRCLLVLASLAIMLPGKTACAADAPMRFIHPPPEIAGDNRHTYYWELLDAALRATRRSHGDYLIASHPLPMSFQRAAAELEAGDRERINIIARATNLELESRLLAIPLPLDKGLLGYRMFLITGDTQKRLDAEVRSLKDLKQFSIGQGSAWTDARILAENDFRLVLTENYENLFQMVGAQRFDLFSRGISEIEPEWRAHKDQIPGLMIEKHLILAYPMPRYFFVPRTGEGRKMADRIEAGLRVIAKNGEFNRLYTRYKRNVLGNLQLAGRRVYRLPNTQLSDKAPPPGDPFWWDSLAAELAPASHRAAHGS